MGKENDIEPHWARFCCLRKLPPGYEAQPAGGFDDDDGALYQLEHVYGPAERLDRRPDVVAGRLDEKLSYWTVSRPAPAGDERPTVRSLSFDDARRGAGRGLTFKQFSTSSFMRERLMALGAGTTTTH